MVDTVGAHEARAARLAGEVQACKLSIESLNRAHREDLAAQQSAFLDKLEVQTRDHTAQVLALTNEKVMLRSQVSALAKTLKVHDRNSSIIQTLTKKIK